jgi:AP-4 complex subunit epsilon-1
LNAQRDLRSQNQWEVCAALSAVTRLIGSETIPAVVHLVKECFAHKSEHVRKKAVMALHRFLQKAPDTVPDCVDHFKRAICDRQAPAPEAKQKLSQTVPD